MKYPMAVEIARQISEEMKPFVVRSKAVGSLRRRKPEVGDIEFVVEPHMKADLVGDKTPDLDELKRQAAAWGEISMNGTRMIQVRKVFGTSLTLELYLCWPPSEWGSMLVVRTGPWELGRALMTRLNALGIKHSGHHLRRKATGELIPTPREEDVFRAAGVTHIPVRLRDAWEPFLAQGVPE